MKRSFFIKKLLLVVLATSVLVGCKTHIMTPTGEKEIEIKQNDCQLKYIELGEEGKIVGLGEGISLRRQMASKTAKVNARQEIAAVINASISSYFEQYSKNYDTGDVTSFESKIEDELRQLVEQNISAAVTVCEKTYAVGNNYKVYACMQLKGDVIGNIADQISKNQKIKIDFDAEKFRKIADEEFRKYRERNK